MTHDPTRGTPEWNDTFESPGGSAVATSGGVAALIAASALHAAENRPPPCRCPKPRRCPKLCPSETDAAPPDPAAIEHLRETGVTVKRVGVIGHDLRFWRVTDADGRQAFIATSREGFVIRARCIRRMGRSLSIPKARPRRIGRTRTTRPRVGSIDRSALQAETDLTWRRRTNRGRPTPPGPTPPRTVWDQLGHATVIEEGKPARRWCIASSILIARTATSSGTRSARR